MDFWQVLGTAVVATGVSLVVTLAFRWWDRKAPRWAVTALALRRLNPDLFSLPCVVRCVFRNIGDAPAFNVRSIQCRAATYDEFQTFVAARISPGEAVEVSLEIDEEGFESGWIEFYWTSNPTWGNSATKSHHLDLSMLYEEIYDSPEYSRQPRLLRRSKKGRSVIDIYGA